MIRNVFLTPYFVKVDQCEWVRSAKCSERALLSFAENSKAEKAFVETHGGNDGLEFCMMLLYSSGALAIYSQEQSLT